MKKSGITMVSILVAIAILTIFATTITVSVINISNDTKLNKFSAELAFVQEAVYTFYDRNNEYPVGKSITIDLSNVEDDDKVQFASEQITENNVTLFEIDLSKLGNIEINYGNKKTEKDIYVVSKDTGIVYYLEGVKIYGDTYFTLTDSLKKNINYVDTNQNVITRDGISFIPNITEWTNREIKTKVIVPLNYDEVTVVVPEFNKNVTGTNLDYKEYLVNEDESIKANYSIVVTYKKNGVENKQSYLISNFDNVAPTLTLSEDISTVSSTDGKENYKYLKIENKTDNLSGIKVIKYEKENIAAYDAVNYFKSNGIVLQDNIIEFDENTKNITVYVEDNAGNYTCINRTIEE